VSSEVAAEAALHCLGVDRADDVLVLSNDGQIEIARALAATARRLGASVDVQQYAAGTRHGEEPPAHVAAAMRAATVILAATTFSLSHTEARQAATAAGARIATMPGITRAVFARALPVDYGDLQRRGERLAAALSAASTCRVVSPAGTDIEFRLESRAAISDDGNLRARAAWGNLPAGEAFIAPIETSAEGHDRLRRVARRVRAAPRAAARHGRRRARVARRR
jgi:leucyl aminopeptidase (aminopeptidase T)